MMTDLKLYVLLYLLLKDDSGKWQQYGVHERDLEELLHDDPDAVAEFTVDNYSYIVSLKGKLIAYFWYITHAATCMFSSRLKFEK